MATVFDVAQYILQKQGEMTTMKLQKLVYFCQAWSLVWDEDPLFNETIEAWANGPVVRKLYDVHKGGFKIDRLPVGNPSVLTDNQKETIDCVLGTFGSKTAQWLSDLSHIDEAWQKVREGLPEGSPCDNQIPLGLIHDYYLSLQV